MFRTKWGPKNWIVSRKLRLANIPVSDFRVGSYDKRKYNYLKEETEDKTEIKSFLTKGKKTSCVSFNIFQLLLTCVYKVNLDSLTVWCVHLHCVYFACPLFPLRCALLQSVDLCSPCRVRLNTAFHVQRIHGEDRQLGRGRDCHLPRPPPKRLDFECWTEQPV